MASNDTKATRLDRELETREETKRPKTWEPAALLPEPDKQPGYSYKWVRTATFGNVDARNVSSKMREGWEPVAKEEQPMFFSMTDENSKFKDNIEIGGLLLCKIPTEFMEQRQKHFAGINKAQMESVDNNFMRENDPRMPLFSDRKSKTSFGSGK